MKHFLLATLFCGCFLAHADLEEISRVGKGPGGLRLRAVGDLVGMPCLNSVRLMDVSDPTEPVLVNEFTTFGSAEDIFYQEPYLFVLSGSDLKVFDLCDISNPEWVTSLALDGIHHFRVMEHQNGTLFAAGTDSTLIAIDIHNPLTPTVVGTFDTGYWWISAFSLSENRVYISSWDVIYVLDSSDPSDLREIYNYSTGIGAPRGLRVDVDNGVMYLWEKNGFYIRGPNGNYENHGLVYGMELIDERLYIARLNGLDIYDVSVPESPVLVRWLYRGFLGNSFMIRGEHLYIAGADRRLSIINLGSGPEVLSADDSARSDFSQVEISGTRMYALDGDSLTVWDISNPAKPVQLADDPYFDSYQIIVDGNILYRIDSGGLTVYDFEDPLSPVVLFERPIKGAEMHKEGNLLVLTGYWLLIYDVSQPASPVLLFENNEYCDSLAGSGGYLYYFVYDPDRLIILDIRDPAHPVTAAEIPVKDPGFISKVVDGKLLLDSYWFIHRTVLYDLSDPINPVLEGDTDIRSIVSFQGLHYIRYVDDEDTLVIKDGWTGPVLETIDFNGRIGQPFIQAGLVAVPNSGYTLLLADPPLCPLDLTGDSVIDQADFNLAMASWTGELGDVNGNGRVELLDLVLLLNGVGPCP